MAQTDAMTSIASISRPISGKRLIQMGVPNRHLQGIDILRSFRVDPSTFLEVMMVIIELTIFIDTAYRITAGV